MDGIIHIAGVMPRIGTTTVALSLVNWLKQVGYNAAYLGLHIPLYRLYPG